jgi:hypothetical protein
MNELIRIDFNAGVLKTPEHTYTMVESLPVDKYVEFLMLQNEVAYGYTFKDINMKHKEIYDALNKTDFVQASAILHNLMNAILTGIDKRNMPILRLCALFLIREDEDATKYNEQINKEKLQDWHASGIDFKDFFHLAAVLVPGLLTALDEISRTISQGEQAVKQMEKKLKKSISGSKKLKSESTGNTSS